jgi:hypothetical protein
MSFTAIFPSIGYGRTHRPHVFSSSEVGSGSAEERARERGWPNLQYQCPFSSQEPFSLGHSLKIRLWIRRLKGEIWLASQRTHISQKLIEKFSIKYVNTNTSFLRNTFLWKLLRVLKRLNSRVRALETTASFLVLPVRCIPGPMKVARGREALRTRMINILKLVVSPQLPLVRVAWKARTIGVKRLVHVLSSFIKYCGLTNYTTTYNECSA